MKKVLIVLLIVILGTCAMCFSSCSNSDVGLQQIFGENNIWVESSGDRQLMAMLKGQEEIGRVELSIEKFEVGEKCYFNLTDLVSDSAENAIGSAISTTKPGALVSHTRLVRYGTESERFAQETFCFFNKDFSLIASIKSEETISGTTTTIARNSDNSKYTYTTYVDGTKNEAKSGSIKNGSYVSSPYYDNSMIYFMARSIPSSYTSYSFNIFNTDVGEKEKVSLTVDTTLKDTPWDNQTVKCYSITMSTTDALFGEENKVTCYINKENHQIAKIVEGEYSYIYMEEEV